MTDQYSSGRYQLFQRLILRGQSSAEDVPPYSRKISTSVYTDQAVFDDERERLFSVKPTALCASVQLEEPGDALVQDWLGLPMVTVRNREGEVKSFINVCRHRGMRLVGNNSLKKLKAMVCPYHQWSYDLNGKLVNVPLESTFKDFEREDHNLVPIATTERHGFIWVQLNGSSKIDLDTHLGTMGEDFDAFKIPEYKLFKRHERVVKSNWKLIQEAF